MAKLANGTLTAKEQKAHDIDVICNRVRKILENTHAAYSATIFVNWKTNEVNTVEYEVREYAIERGV